MIRVAVIGFVIAGCSPSSGIHTPDAAQDARDAWPDAAPPPPPPPAFAQTAYIKSTRPVHDAHFGQPALSGDGTTLVATQQGTVSVYTRDGAWRVAGELVPASTSASSNFGWRVAISNDGTTIAVAQEGSAFVFRRAGDAWIEDAHITSLLEVTALALDRTGTLLVVGSRNQSSDFVRVRTYRRLQTSWSMVSSLDDGSADVHLGGALAVSSDASMLVAGTEVFERTNDTWTKVARLVAPDPGVTSMFASISCSQQCQTIVVGDEQLPGMMNEVPPGPGVAYVFERTGSVWTHTASLAALGGDPGERFGFAVAVSDDGSTIVAGAPAEDTAATGINSAGTDAGALYSGAAYVFRRFSGAWWQVMYLKASNAAWIDIFGQQLAISNDGRTIATAAPYEASSAQGVGGDQSDDSLPYAGAVYLFEGEY